MLRDLLQPLGLKKPMLLPGGLMYPHMGPIGFSIGNRYYGVVNIPGVRVVLDPNLMVAS